MPYVPNVPEDYDVDEATDRLLERYTPDPLPKKIKLNPFF